MSPSITEGLSEGPEPQIDFAQAVSEAEAAGVSPDADVPVLETPEQIQAMKMALLDDRNDGGLKSVSKGLTNDDTTEDANGYTAADRARLAAENERIKAEMAEDPDIIAARSSEQVRDWAANQHVIRDSIDWVLGIHDEAIELMAADDDGRNYEIQRALAYDTLQMTPGGPEAIQKAVQDGLITSEELAEVDENANYLYSANELIQNANAQEAARDDRWQAAEKLASAYGPAKVEAAINALVATGANVGGMNGQTLTGAIRGQLELDAQHAKAAADISFKTALMASTPGSVAEGLTENGRAVREPYVAEAKIDMGRVFAALDPQPSRSQAIRAGVGNPGMVDQGMAHIRSLASKAFTKANQGR